MKVAAVFADSCDCASVAIRAPGFKLVNAFILKRAIEEWMRLRREGRYGGVHMGGKHLIAVHGSLCINAGHVPCRGCTPKQFA